MLKISGLASLSTSEVSRKHMWRRNLRSSSAKAVYDWVIGVNDPPRDLVAIFWSSWDWPVWEGKHEDHQDCGAGMALWRLRLSLLIMLGVDGRYDRPQEGRGVDAAEPGQGCNRLERRIRVGISPVKG